MQAIADVLDYYLYSTHADIVRALIKELYPLEAKQDNFPYKAAPPHSKGHTQPSGKPHPPMLR